MQPPLAVLLLVLAAAAYSAQAFLLLPAAPSSSSPLPVAASLRLLRRQQQQQQQRSLLGLARRPSPRRAGSDNDWPSDSSDMEDTSGDAAAATAAAEAVVDVEARKATIQELEQELLLLLVGNNRGFNVQEKERERIDEAIVLLVRARGAPHCVSWAAVATTPPPHPTPMSTHTRTFPGGREPQPPRHGGIRNAQLAADRGLAPRVHQRHRRAAPGAAAHRCVADVLGLEDGRRIYHAGDNARWFCPLLLCVCCKYLL